MPRERDDIEYDIEELSARLDGQNDKPSKQDIYRALDLLKAVEAYLVHFIAESGLKCESKTNVVVLGPSGAGKSTVVSFLFGTGRLIVRHQGRLSRSLVADPPLPGVEIRGGAISSTLLPVVNHVRLRSGMIAVWDMPGCRDTRGPFAELVVHFIYKWLLKNKGNLRFLLVRPPLHERLQRVTIRDLINGSLIREDNSVLVCMSDWLSPNANPTLEIAKAKLVGLKNAVESYCHFEKLRNIPNTL